MNVKKHIFLTGFMGAGKTTTGKCLAEMIGCGFIDLDVEIVKKDGRTITEIFAEDGESFFRDCETETLNKIKSQKPAVIATGGGIVQRDMNRSIMRNSGLIIFLNTKWETLKNRLAASQDRPLVDPGNNWEEVRKRWEARQVSYHDVNHIIHTDDLSPSQVASKIKSLLEAGVLQ